MSTYDGPVRSTPAALVPLLIGLALAAGCGAPPELTDPPRAPLPVPSSSASPPPSQRPPTFPGESGQPTDGPRFPEEIAMACAGQPGGEEIVETLRASNLLPAGVEAEVVDGPYCSGTWQYAMVSVPDRDPLQVITEGKPGALTLVTVGTDVCTVEVRMLAPAGIRAVAACLG